MWLKRENVYLMREMSECPAALVTMLISVRGLGSAATTEMKLFNSPTNCTLKEHKINKNNSDGRLNTPESIVIDFGSFTG